MLSPNCPTLPPDPADQLACLTHPQIMEFGLQWVHNINYVGRYELILKLDGALWPRIILKLLLTPKGTI